MKKYLLLLIVLPLLGMGCNNFQQLIIKSGTKESLVEVSKKTPNEVVDDVSQPTASELFDEVCDIGSNNYMTGCAFDLLSIKTAERMWKQEKLENLKHPQINTYDMVPQLSVEQAKIRKWRSNFEMMRDNWCDATNIIHTGSGTPMSIAMCKLGFELQAIEDLNYIYYDSILKYVNGSKGIPDFEQETYVFDKQKKVVDSDFTTSTDKTFVAFVRDDGKALVEKIAGKVESTRHKQQLWVTYIVDDEKNGFPSGLQDRLFDTATIKKEQIKNLPKDFPFKEISDISDVVVSNDSKTIYFIVSAWVTSGAVLSVNRMSGEIKYISDGNSLMAIRQGDFIGNLITLKHRYGKVSSYDEYSIIDENNGRSIESWEYPENDNAYIVGVPLKRDVDGDGIKEFVIRYDMMMANRTAQWMYIYRKVNGINKLIKIFEGDPYGFARLNDDNSILVGRFVPIEATTEKNWDDFEEFEITKYKSTLKGEVKLSSEKLKVGTYAGLNDKIKGYFE